MTITSIKKGVFDLDDVFKKIQAGVWITYDPNPDPKELYSWGYAQTGRLGKTVPFPAGRSPGQIPGTNWLDSNSGFAIGNGIKCDGTMWIWGSSCCGALGNNSNIDNAVPSLPANPATNPTAFQSSPIQLPGTTWCALARGSIENFNAALKSDGTLWAWGKNLCGNLAQGNGTHRSSPVQVPGTTWVSAFISAAVDSGDNYNTMWGIKTDGTLWGAGSNVTGKIGVGTGETPNPCYNTMTQIPGTWTDISAGLQNVIATKSDGTAWTWGSQNFGAGAQNNVTDRSSPIQIPGSWTRVRAGKQLIGAGVKSDGTLWSWGYNQHGTLGHGGRVHVSSPVQIPGTQWTTRLSVSNCRMFAIKRDGTLWSWGHNSFGTLGLSDIINRSSPNQVPGNQWFCVSEGNCALTGRTTLGGL